MLMRTEVVRFFNETSLERRVALSDFLSKELLPYAFHSFLLARGIVTTKFPTLCSLPFNCFPRGGLVLFRWNIMGPV